jgi:PII-like signaling protein
MPMPFGRHWGLMLTPGAAKKVIIHLNEDTSSARDFLYTEIFRFLFDRGVAGATMIRPYAGFGSHHQLHSMGGGSVAGEHLPVRIEFLESPEVIDGLLPSLCDLVTDGLVETQTTTIVKSARRVQPV